MTNSILGETKLHPGKPNRGSLTSKVVEILLTFGQHSYPLGKHSVSANRKRAASAGASANGFFNATADI